MKPPRVTPEEMIRLYQSGMEMEDIRDQYGYKNINFIRSVLRDAGVLEKTTIDVGKINALHKAGWSLKKIAMEECLSVETVQEALDKRKARKPE